MGNLIGRNQMPNLLDQYYKVLKSKIVLINFLLIVKNQAYFINNNNKSKPCCIQFKQSHTIMYLFYHRHRHRCRHLNRHHRRRHRLKWVYKIKSIDNVVGKWFNGQLVVTIIVRIVVGIIVIRVIVRVVLALVVVLGLGGRGLGGGDHRRCRNLAHVAHGCQTSQH